MAKDVEVISGTLEDMASFLETIIHSIMPEADGSYTLEVTHPEGAKKINVTVGFSDDKYVGLLIGKKMKNILMLRTWVLSQRIYTEGRLSDVDIVINKADGDVKVFADFNKREKPRD
jgi:hypothetical protein